MPRLPRIYIKDALYFITCRGEHGETLFKDERDYRMFLDLMKRYQEQYEIKLFAYCLLPDHLHLLLEMEKPTVSDFMRDLNNNYTKYYNSRYDRKGHLFRERFKSAVIEKDSHLLKMTAYIHVNPEKIGLVKDAKDYPYSTYQTYLYNEKCTDGELDSLRKAVLEALNLLGNRPYEEFVRGTCGEDGERIHKKLQYGGILGTEDFVNKVKAEVEAYQAKGLVEKSETSWNNGYRLYLLFGTLFLVLVVSAGGVFLFFFKKDRAAAGKTPDITVETAIQKTDDLKTTEWQIKLVEEGGKETVDTITFSDGKFVSANLNGLGFPSSNYSLSIEDNGRMVWETMQTAARGEVASWHGEIEQGKMTGILSLRQAEKKPQDFSFKSVSYRRRK
ncbi:MAG: REP-associated tyrosine transposase [Deltaproteobacteria bacterium]